eukprot:CAMPEP_0180400074 /NCGR_PEP_ID=MMETSP0989-20121125/37520_1 /TAXON_ID=697907 /ORGANISM="non described non described, Strain CCMP2293" /LENGTH=78 /DNA_ID=CAMNT_0022402863 /DNA_START=164 /DNA_END=397 /DNA_ORIENTATION=-
MPATSTAAITSGCTFFFRGFLTPVVAAARAEARVRRMSCAIPELEYHGTRERCFFGGSALSFPPHPPAFFETSFPPPP